MGPTLVPHLCPIWGTWGTYTFYAPFWGTYFNQPMKIWYPDFKILEVVRGVT